MVHNLLQGLLKLVQEHQLVLKGPPMVHNLLQGLLKLLQEHQLVLKGPLMVHNLELKVQVKGRGTKRRRYLHHNQRDQKARRKRLLLELRVQSQLNIRNFY
jgi:hypothetical protein